MSGVSELPAAEGPYIPFIFETDDLGPLFAAPLHERFTDAELREFVFGGEPLPPAVVPLDGSGLFLLTALVCVAAVKLARLSA